MRRALARTDVGAMLAIFRAAAGLAQLELGNLVTGWSQSTVSLIERRRRDTLYDIRELLRFADAVDMPREALLPVVLGNPVPPERVGSAHVRYLRTCVQQLNDRGDELGGGAVLRQALRQFARARAMLDESDYTSEIGRQLLVVTAELGVVAAWQAYDCADQPLARRLYGDAAMLASSAEHPELTVHIYLRPLRIVADRADAEEFRTRFDAAERALAR